MHLSFSLRLELRFKIANLKYFDYFYFLIIYGKWNICSQQWKYFLTKQCSCSLIKQMRGCVQVYVRAYVCFQQRSYH